MDARRRLDILSRNVDSWPDPGLVRRLTLWIGSMMGETTARLIQEVNNTRRAYNGTMANMDTWLQRQLSMTLVSMQDYSRRIHHLQQEDRTIIQGLQGEIQALSVRYSLVQSALTDLQTRMDWIQAGVLRSRPSGMATPLSIPASDLGSFASVLSSEELIGMAQQVAYHRRRQETDDM